MMDFPLTLTAIFRRAETLFGEREIVWRRPDRILGRYTYRDFSARTRRLAGALRNVRVEPGDRVATLAWNHSQHLETYFAAPAIGAVLHTLNLRLHPDELTYVINHAGDRVLIVDASLAPLFARIRANTRVETVIVIGEKGPLGDAIEYESAIAGARPVDELPDLDEQSAAAMCYTSGTTGRPKGVVYSHRSLVLHSMAIATGDAMGLSARDVITPVVPMFHANAWGLPYAGVMLGSKFAMPGPHLDPASLADLYQRERVTITAGVPTIWMGLLQLLDENPGAYDLRSLRALFVGGSAAPQSMIEGFEKRHELHVIHGWGMTETSPVGTLSNLPEDMEDASPDMRFHQLAKQGRPLPFVEIRARNESGLAAWDGRTMGELEVRGPWIAGAYFNQDGGDRFTPDGWFKTGDIVTIDERGTIDIQDRSKDLIKSGGEWISSIALENALMAHPSVAEAAVIAVAHPKWCERPLAAVVLRKGATADAAELCAFLAARFPKFWLPDAFEFLDAIPRTAAGKFLKSVLRERFKDYWVGA